MKSTVVKSIILFAAAASMVACKNKQAKEVNTEEQIPLVSVVKAYTEDVIDDQVYSSTVKPWAKNNIAPQTGGRIEELLVEVGDYVSAGQVVAKMDDLQLRQSELQVANDKIEYERLKSLYQQGGLSQSDFEAFELACNVHRSTYENLQKNTVLRSPISGVISARNYDKGDMYAMAMPLYTVEQIVPVKLLVGISESDYNRVKKGDKATLTVDAFPTREFNGIITNLYPTIDANTHTFTAEVKVANADRKLRPGMYARVTVTFGKASRVIVPDVAVVKQQGSGDRYVYVLNRADNTVKFQKVVLGRRLGDRYVILDGIAEGDEVVTEGMLRIKDGVTVKVK